ncbi:MAG: radical SAM protein, partial [Chloroflexi bacterium]|nr:radical SAM protein [Chloroflexota bacterium]
GAQVVLGGPEPPNYADEYLAHGADVIVLGEGELTLEELLPRLAQAGPQRLAGIAGIAYRNDDGVIARNPPRPYISNLDLMPHPDRAAIDLPRYVQTWRTHHGQGSASLICARGCPYHCTWCSHTVYGETHRRRSPENVADEVELLMEQYKPDMLWYADDVFTIHTRWFYRYADELKRRGIKIPFECITRGDRMNPQVIETLAQMGCFRVWIGSESGSQRVLDAMRREVTVEEVRTATHLAKQHGIEVGMFIMLGFEGEEPQDLEATVDHLKKADPDIFLTTVSYPIKGTPYYQQVAGRVLASGGWEQWSDRSLSVRGRKSRTFYSHATRWMVGAVALHRQLNGQGFNPLKTAKAAGNVALGRLGMMMTQKQVEG